METDLYILDWGNGMVGIFKGSTLGQCNNGSKSSFISDLKYVMRLYNMNNSANIHFLESREELQKLREERGLEKKPTLDEYLAQQGFDYGT